LRGDMTKKEFTKKELLEIEKLSRERVNVKDIAKRYGFSQKSFYRLRLENTELNSAIEKGKSEREPIKYNRKPKENKKQKVNWDKIPVPVELDSKVALKKFKEEFERKKRERDMKELKDLDLI